MKKISATLDGLRVSKSTLDYGINLAKAAKAALSGVFLESFLYNSYNLEDVIGKHGISQAKVKHAQQKDDKARDLLVDLFEKQCKKEGLKKYTLHRDTGITFIEIIRESIYSDLLIVNNQDTFTTIPQKKPSQFIRELLSDVQCPLLVVPEVYQEIEKVIILYDGKPRAVAAIKMFYYMFTWLQNSSIELLSVSEPNGDIDMPNQELMDEFIQYHYPNAKFTLLKGDPEATIINYLSHATANTLVVMGANQRNRISRLFNASLAEKVLQQIELPILIINSN